MTFDEVRPLDDRALRELLAGDDPVLRVYAIWALAMRGATEVVLEHAGDEPSAGVRRHLAIILAGAGEIDLVIALARHDPEAGVRTTAAALVCRLAAGGRVAWVVALEGLLDPSPEVKKAVLRELRGAPVGAIEGPVLRALDDPERDVRLEAVETALALLPADEVIPRLVAWQRAAPLAEARQLLERWASITGSPAVHAALRAAPPRTRVFAVRVLSATWDDVASLAEDPDPEVRAAVQRSFWTRLGTVPVARLVHWLDGDGTWRSAPRAISTRLAAGEAISDDLLAEVRDQAVREIAQIDAYLRREGVDPERPVLAEAPTDPSLPFDWERHDTLEWHVGERALLTDLLDRIATPSHRAGDPSAPSDGQMFRI
jgi:HEAT repeat protein